MRVILLAWILLTVSVLFLQGCLSTTTSAVIGSDDKGLVVKPVVPFSPVMLFKSFLTGFAISHCSTDPEFRGCSDIFCQLDSRHKNCTDEAKARLKKKGVQI